jgi:L,D-transpeptidase ErfK/SrfK
LLICLLVAVPLGPASGFENDAVIGKLGVHRTVSKDTLLDIALRYDLGYVELVAANPGIDPWVPGVDKKVMLPTSHLLPDAPRDGIVVNLAEMRLYYYPPGGGDVRTFPIGIGREGWETPLGRTQIVGKREHPSWVPPDSIRKERPGLPAVVPPGPANPLGRHALDLGWARYVIHGTNKPYGIGRRVSHGCIRLYPWDIAWLFSHVRPGTSVEVVDQAVKLGWSGGELYIEAHPTQRQADAIEAGKKVTAELAADLVIRIADVAGFQATRLDWQVIRRVVRERRGIPIRITR